MLDSAFSAYYARFRELNALSKEDAVTLDLALGILRRIGILNF